MDKRPDFKAFKKKALKNAKVKAEYEALRPKFEPVLALNATYKEFLNNELKDPKLALNYLNEALKDKDVDVFLIALKDVLVAQCAWDAWS